MSLNQTILPTDRYKRVGGGGAGARVRAVHSATRRGTRVRSRTPRGSRAGTAGAAPCRRRRRRGAPGQPLAGRSRSQQRGERKITTHLSKIGNGDEGSAARAPPDVGKREDGRTGATDRRPLAPLATKGRETFHHTSPICQIKKFLTDKREDGWPGRLPLAMARHEGTREKTSLTSVKLLKML